MATQLAPRDQDNPLIVLRSQLEQRADEFRMVLPSHITPEKLQRTVLTAVQLNPDLLNADRRSFLTACFKAAQDALLPDGREAALVVYNTRQKIDGQWSTVKQAQYLPMVFGLRKKILQSDEITDLFASVVYKQEIAAGRFLYEEGTERMLRHKPILDPSFEPKDEDIALAYSVATFKDGTKSFEVMRRAEIDRIRQLSQTGATGKTTRQGEPIAPKGPWVDHYSEMAKKTVIRRHSKSLPMSGDVFADVEAADIDAAARSAVAALATPGGQPKALEDQTEETPHDAETGEIHEDEQNTQGESGTAREASGASESTDAESGTANSPPSTEAEEMPVDEQTGITQDPAEAAGDKILQGFAAATTMIDLNNLKKEADKHLEFMPGPIAEAIEGGYERHKRRLTQQAEPAK